MSRKILLLLFVCALPAFAQDPHAGHTGQAQPGTLEPVQIDIPDVTVLDEEGNSRRFYSDLVKGRVVAVNFLFTNCTTICPPLGATFGRLRKLLGERAGRDIHLISISVDPTNDTPARLKAWSAKFGQGPGWHLITGEKAEIVRLLKALGAYTADPNNHPPLVLIGDDADGHWTRAYGLAPPARLAELIDQVAQQPAPGAAP